MMLSIFSYLGNFGCDGGWPAHAFLDIRKAGGINTESKYPYHAKASYIVFKYLDYICPNSLQLKGPRFPR